MSLYSNTQIKLKLHLPHNNSLSKTQRRRKVKLDLGFEGFKASSSIFLEIINQGMMAFHLWVDFTHRVPSKLDYKASNFPKKSRVSI